MNIRRAQEKDIPRLIELLEQVLQIHADIRPDIFIPGTTKYTNEELAEMIKDDTKPIYVAADDDDVCMGYAFCQIRQQPFSNNMVPFTSLFIDDLCVDASESSFLNMSRMRQSISAATRSLSMYGAETHLLRNFMRRWGLRQRNARWSIF